MGVITLASVDIEYLKKESNSSDSGSDYVLKNIFLSMDQNDVHVDCEEARIYFQKAELDLVINHLCRTIMKIEIILIFDVVER